MWKSWKKSSGKFKYGTLWYEKYQPTKENIKILGVRISYNKKIQDNLNFCKTIKKYLYCYKALTYEKIINNLKNCTLSYNNKVSNIAIGKLKPIQKLFVE